jgi:hypothetical protein
VYGYTPNAITTYTNVQNFGGNSTQTLQNEYFDLSAPVGLEVKILGNEKLQISVAATLEPTYLLNRNSYLLATDYSNYIKDPTLFRRWKTSDLNNRTAIDVLVSTNTFKRKGRLPHLNNC